MAEINRIAGIILAAGASKRMVSGPKQLLTFEGKTLLRRSVESAIAAEFSPVVVVLGENATAAMRGEVDNLLVSIAVNGQSGRGMGSSIRVGMEALAVVGGLRGVALMLCDQPLVTGEVLRRLVHNFSRVASGISAASYQGTLGVPAVFGPEFFAELGDLPDEQGAKGLLRREGTRGVAMPEAGSDVDDAGAYGNLIGVMPLLKGGKRRSASKPAGN